MADIELVIKIPNSLYANLSKITNGSIASKRILDCVKNGIPIPKGHGRLIDGDELESRMKIGYCIVKNAPTIIEADKGEE